LVSVAPAYVPSASVDEVLVEAAVVAAVDAGVLAVDPAVAVPEADTVPLTMLGAPDAAAVSTCWK
jgi:hypothetical protein